MRRPGLLLLFLSIVGAVAFFGAQFPPAAWHASLVKPAWNPPNAVFAPVWGALYLLIAVAGWRLAIRTDESWARGALVVWGVQLLVNAFWSVLFFGLHRPGAALIDIGILLALIGLFIAICWRRDPVASSLFAPYFLWVAFATALNVSIFLLNPSVVPP
ncbi:MAG: TspO/MBR family protein [Thermoanaerobaculia bacterium]